VGLICDETTKKCSLPGSTYNGCTKDADCPANTPPMKCEKTYCYTPGNTATCTTDSQCDVGFYCQKDVHGNGTCVVPPPPVDKTAKFIGLTSLAYDGNQGGYRTVDSYCDGETVRFNGSGSHVCTSKDIINSYNIADPDTLAQTGAGWINSAAPGNISPMVNDCKGWLSNVNNPYYGTTWNFTQKISGIQPCGATKKFACCK
jgi:hypothetical protein